MVKFNLEIKATLDKILRVVSGKEYVWFLKIKCSNCGELSDKWHDVCFSETILNRHAKSDMNFCMKCKLCGRENWMLIIPESFADYVNTDSDKFKSIVSFDCRGLEPIDFSPRGGWTIEIEDGGKYENVDLTEKEWTEYDEKISEPVGLFDLQSRIIKSK